MLHFYAAKSLSNNANGPDPICSSFVIYKHLHRTKKSSVPDYKPNICEVCSRFVALSMNISKTHTKKYFFITRTEELNPSYCYYLAFCCCPAAAWFT